MNLDLSKVNMGKTDRLIRAIVGFALVLTALRLESWLFGLLALALMGTAYLRYCPIYNIIEVNTNNGEPPTDR